MFNKNFATEKQIKYIKSLVINWVGIIDLKCYGWFLILANISDYIKLKLSSSNTDLDNLTSKEASRIISFLKKDPPTFYTVRQKLNEESKTKTEKF